MRDHQSCDFEIDMQPTTYWPLVSHQFKIYDKKMKSYTILAKKIFRLSILVYLLTNEMNIILFQINIYFVLLLLDLMTACIHQGSDSQSFWKYSGVIALQTSFEIRNLFFFLLWVTITFKRLDQFCCAKRRKDAF